MQIYENVLNENTLNLIYRELTHFMEHEHLWSCSNFKWGDKFSNLRTNISGTTMVAKVSDTLTEIILEDLDDVLPSMNHKLIKYFVWLPNSGISKHTDYTYKFGSTIYLNESWDINDGGLFLYENATDDWRVHIPRYNTMVVNDTGLVHMVTPVSAFAKHNRYTIQIFGDLVNE